MAQPKKTQKTLSPYATIGVNVAHFQEELLGQGRNLREEIRRLYVNKWRSPALAHVAKVRTALVAGMTDYLVASGLVNLERVQLSLLTDPLAHEVERLAEIPYGRGLYVATHSMIYAKFLACTNPHLPGVFVDSPNLRLELPASQQRGRYLLDFSQLDVELRRQESISRDAYYDSPQEVVERLQVELRRALRFFEGMLRAGLDRVRREAAESVAALGVKVELPSEPFPVFYLDEALQRFSRQEVEQRLGELTPAPAFFILGLLRENYDLVYPYLRRDGSRPPLATLSSRHIFNYDLVLKGTLRDGTPTPGVEVLSGGLREWLPEAIVARLLDQGQIPEAPRFVGGHLTNPEKLGGYGPFLTVVCDPEVPFPATYGGGMGIERLLWALLRGPAVSTIEDVTFFGKNPDSARFFLF